MSNRKKIGIILVILVISLNVFSAHHSFQTVSQVTNEETNDEFVELPLPTAVEVNCELVGEWDEAYGEPQDIFVSDGFAYVSSGGGGVQIFDISDPANPIFAGKYEQGISATSIFVRDSLAYVCCPSELVILNVSDPQAVYSLGYLGHSGTYGDAIDVSGDLVFLGLIFGGLKIVNVSNPSLPVQTAYYSGLSYIFRQVRVFDDYVYLCYNDDGLEIVNITKPDAPTFVTTIGAGHSVGDVLVENDSLFVTGIDQSIHLYNISDITNPSLILDYSSHLGYFSEPPTLQLENTTLTVISYSSVSFVDISNMSEPMFLSSVGTNDLVLLGCCLQNGFVFLAGYETCLIIVNATDPAMPQVIAEISAGGAVYDFWLTGNYAVVTNDWFGASVLDLSDPLHPVELSSVRSDPNGYFTEIAGKDTYAYITNSRDVHVVDISNPTNISIVNTIINDGYGTSLFVQGNYLFETTENGLLIYNITVPSTPTFVSEYLTDDFASCVYVDGNFAFVCGDFYGVDIVNITDIQHPSFVTSFCDTYMFNRDISVFKDRAYMLNGAFGLLVCDISNFYNVHIIRAFSGFTGYQFGLFVQGDWVYTASYLGGMSILNFHNITKYPVIGMFNDYHRGSNVQAINHTIFLADGFGGFKIIQLDMLDSDNDFLPDELETNHYQTDANDNDTDKDGILDGLEAFQASDPLDPNDPVSQTKRFGFSFEIFAIIGFYCLAGYVIISRRKNGKRKVN